MNIDNGHVVELTWALRDTRGELLDEATHPLPFLVGSSDLLPKMSEALLGHTSGDEMELHLEPEHAFGDYDAKRVFFAQRARLPKVLNSALEEGSTLEAKLFAGGAHGAPADLLTGLPDDTVFRVTELYDEHVVLDGNHPLAGIALRIDLKVHTVRPAEPDEAEAGTAQADVGPEGWASIMAELAVPPSTGPSSRALH